MQAVGYVRFSHPNQKKGSSEARQDEMISEFCAGEGWPVTRWVSDHGVSASTGKNLTTGSLSDFVREVETEGGHGLVLVVECQDRLSRIHEIDFFEWFMPLLRTGLTVAFCDNGMIVDQHSIRNQKRQMRRIMDDAEEATRYTERLGRRVRAAWQEMRDTGKPVHCVAKNEGGKGTCPAWLEMTADRSAFRTDTATALYRIALINEMFDLYIGGMGFAAMERFLNERGEPTWRGGQGWRKSTLKRIINGREVLGEYQHRVRREPVGDPQPDYFPQVVTNEKWLLANSRAHRTIMVSHNRRKLLNLLSDVARCSGCGSRMLFRNKARKANGEPVAYLQCDNAARRMGCERVTMVRYYPLERQILDTLLVRALSDQHFQADDEVASIKRAMADKQREIDDIQVRIDNCLDTLETFKDKPALKAKVEIRAMTAEADLDTATKEKAILEAQLDRARGKASRAEHVKRVSEIRADLRHEDDAARDAAGLLVKAALTEFIEVVEIDAMRGFAAARLTGPLGLAIFAEGKQPQFYDLVKRGADYSYRSTDEQRVVQAYLKRVG